MKKSLRSKEQQKLQQILVSLRKEKGWLQNELAGKLDKPQSFVSKYEIGERRLDVIEVFYICKALGVPFIEFAKRFEKTA